VSWNWELQSLICRLYQGCTPVEDCHFHHSIIFYIIYLYLANVYKYIKLWYIYRDWWLVSVYFSGLSSNLMAFYPTCNEVRVGQRRLREHQSLVVAVAACGLVHRRFRWHLTSENPMENPNPGGIRVRYDSNDPETWIYDVLPISDRQQLRSYIISNLIFDV